MRAPDWLSFWLGAGLSAWVIGVYLFVMYEVTKTRRKKALRSVEVDR